MTNQTPPEGTPAPEPTLAGAETAADKASGVSGSGPFLDVGALVSAFELLKAENADLKDRLLRAHAEMDNFRKRTDREKSDSQKYAVTKFAQDIVTVGDNFQRAIDSVPAEAVEQAPALKSFFEGVTMTERELLNALERHGIKRMDPKGQPFNPHHHQAVMEQPNADVPSGTVTQVFQFGYMIEDRVLRPAMVVVAKGGLKPARQVDPAATAASAANDDNPPNTSNDA